MELNGHDKIRSRPQCLRHIATGIALVVWWSVFVSLLLPLQRDGTDAATKTTSGSLIIQILVISLAAIGALQGRPILALLWARLRWEFIFLSLYLAWSLLTILWSQSPALSCRRLLSFILITYGCLTLGAGYYGGTERGLKTLMTHLVFGALGAAFVVVGFTGADLSVTNLLDPAWSSAAKLSPELVYICGFALAACLLVYRLAPVRLGLACGVFTFVIAIMKFRSIGVSILAATLPLYILLNPKKQKAYVFLGIIVTSLIIISYIIDGESITHTINMIAARGDDYDTNASLNGRLPLWEYAWANVTARPVIGYGFGAFWTPGRLDEVAKVVGWNAVFAHQGYLDELLATGVIGLFGLLTFWCVIIRRLWILCASHDSCRPYALVALSWTLMLLSFNTMDTIFQYPLKVPYMICLVGYSAIVVSSSKTTTNRFKRTPLIISPKCNIL